MVMLLMVLVVVVVLLLLAVVVVVVAMVVVVVVIVACPTGNSPRHQHSGTYQTPASSFGDCSAAAGIC